MGNGYAAQPEGLEALRSMILELRTRLSELERPTGTSISSLVAQVQAKLAELDLTVAALASAYLSAHSYDQATIDAKIASPGAIAPTNVTASGSAVFPGGVNSVDVYNRLLTYGGPYSSQYIHSDGTMGYVPSSGEFKQDIEMWACDPVIVSYLRVVSFRYIDAVSNLGDAADVEIGLIAEEVHDLGFAWLIDYALRLTEAGKLTPVPYAPERHWVPFGVKYERLSLVLLVWAQSVIAWQQTVESRLAALEG